MPDDTTTEPAAISGQLDIFGALAEDAGVSTPAELHAIYPLIGWHMGGEPRVLLHRSGCATCEWHSGEHRHENRAVEAAMDHAWPGWRTLPVVKAKPYGHNEMKEWRDGVAAIYPPRWVEAGGPVRTARWPIGNRHHYDSDPEVWDIAYWPGCGQ